MFSETMTVDELFLEWRHDMYDLPFLVRTAWYGRLFKKIRKGEARFPLTKTIKRTTSRGNTYLIVFRFEKREDVFLTPYPYYIGLQEKKGHLHVILPVAEPTHRHGQFRNNILYFWHHVFYRYKKRLKLDLDEIEVIKLFFENNPIWMEQEKFARNIPEAKENETMLMGIEGAVFGEKQGHHTICRTFVDNSHLNASRAQLNDEYNRRIRRDIAVYSTLPDNLEIRMALEAMKER